VSGAERDDGFEEAFDDLFPRAVRLAHRLLGDRAAAEDIAAEALARTYARWSKVGGLSYRDGWVLKVTTNLAIDRLRRRPPEVSAAAAPDFEDGVALRMSLNAALLTLAPRQRQAVALHYLGGLSDREVAQALGISLGSVKTHIHRGITCLRARLGAGLEEVVPVGVD
jgi:RNA polymerase sigma-70 factor (sigma-E family)